MSPDGRPTPLELLLPSGFSRRSLVLGSACPPALRPPDPQPASVEEYELVVVAPTLREAHDRAWLQITAESRARNPRDAQKTNSDVMSVVLQKLRGAGLAADALQTRGYDLQPEFDYNNGRQTLKGYVARNSLEVRVDELARLGEILDLAVTFGATTVGMAPNVRRCASRSRTRAIAPTRPRLARA